MFRILALLALIIAISGCSSSKTKFVDSDPSIPTDEGVSTPVEVVQAKKADVDYSQPATFEQYRQWRKANDPSGQTYAEYKQWEAEYKQWIENQAKVLQP